MSHPVSRHAAHRAQTARKLNLPSTQLAIARWPSDDAAWLITMSDLTLLLLCFLVMWYVADGSKVAQQRSDGSPPIITQKTDDVVSPSNPIGPKLEEWQRLRQEMAGYVADLGLSGAVTVESAPSEMIISLNDTVPFASGKADLQPRAVPVIEKVAEIALSQPTLSLEIEGHADDRPISTMEFPSNWELSTARASRVARHLIGKGVPPSRIAVQGYASFKPRVADSSAGSRRANRRVEIRLYYSGSPASPGEDAGDVKR